MRFIHIQNTLSDPCSEGFPIDVIAPLMQDKFHLLAKRHVSKTMEILVRKAEMKPLYATNSEVVVNNGNPVVGCYGI
jgi:hypothetical protein